MKIYTRTGDDGSTALFGGDRVAKTDLRVVAYGDVDELNSVLGWVLAEDVAEATASRLNREQQRLFELGAQLADPKASISGSLFAGGVAVLEGEMDQLEAELEPLKNFILPAGSEPVARLHLARTVCRRAERAAVALASAIDIDPSVVTYLNRLSDYLFVAARFEAKERGEQEVEWKGGG